MANKLDNLMPIEEVNSRRTPEQHSEDSRRAGIRSGEVRRERKTMKETLLMCLQMENAEGKTYQDLATLGLLKGAMKGNANNYELILKLLGELEDTNRSKQESELSKLDELLNEIKGEATK